MWILLKKLEILNLTLISGGIYMAKKKIPKEKGKNKLIPQQGRFKGDLVDENRLEDYELSEEFTKNNPLKMPPKKLSGKKNKQTK